MGPVSPGRPHAPSPGLSPVAWRARSFALSLGCASLALAACDGTDGAGPPVSPAAAEASPLRLTGTPPALVTDDTGAPSPADPRTRAASLSNADAEGSVEDGAGGGTAVPGWAVSGDCSVEDADVAAGNGTRRFRLGADCTLAQTSDTLAATDHALGAELVIAAFGGTDATLLVELTVGAAPATAIARRELRLVPGAADWQLHQIVAPFGALDAHVGEPLGIRLTNVSSGGAPVALDDVRLAVHEPGERGTRRFANTWAGDCDQRWAGADFWANRLHDWHVVDGRLETRDANANRPLRTVHRIASVVRTAPEAFTLRVRTGVRGTPAADAWSGFLIGAGATLDHRGAALVHNRAGRGGGLIAGIDASGRPFVRDNGVAAERLASGAASETIAARARTPGTGIVLQLDAVPVGGDYRLRVFALDDAGTVLGSAEASVPSARLLGNIALAANAGREASRHWFDAFEGGGAKLREVPARRFGPVLFATHTVSRGALTMNVQYPQACEARFADVRLEVPDEDGWRSVATGAIDPASRTARLRVEAWNVAANVPYRIATDERRGDATTTHHYHGTVRAEPMGDAPFVIGVFNCRPGIIVSDTEGWIQQNNARPFTWTEERVVVPHAELLGNASTHDADLLVFLGDQLYEFDPNGFVDKRNLDALIDDYLWKWFQFGWSVREYTRNTPAFAIPDDHDVYQGNLWGQGGRQTSAEGDGGYVHPAAFVQVVQRTQAGSLPPPFDPTPVEQGIDVYYTDLVHAGVGIAVLEDRKFKTGANSPERPRRLLGNRQLDFLDAWARDWEGQSVKLAISQSPFAQGTTHSGAAADPVGVDRDSNGWPGDRRDVAVAALRRARAPHVTGDQHLGMSLHHGIDRHGDAIHSFAGPSMLNVFPRVWDPANAGPGPGDRSDDRLGLATDPHGNRIDVLAVANPDVYYDGPPPPGSIVRKEALGIGYGIVRIDRRERTYAFEAWPANRDPAAPGARPYAGWPVVVRQSDNDGRVPAGFLPPRTAAVAEPVVEVVDESDGALVYAERSSRAAVTLPVHDAGTSYRVTLSDPASGYVEVFEEQRVVR